MTQYNVQHIKIMQSHLDSAYKHALVDQSTLLTIINKAIEIALAEQAIKQPEPVEPHAELTQHPVEKLGEWVPIPTCQVRNLDTGELKTMTREAAKLLQAETKDVCDWLTPCQDNCYPHPFSFNESGIYTYKLKGTVKLTIDNKQAKMLTPAQCEAERLARIDTHDVYVRDIEFTQDWNILMTPSFSSEILEYRLIRKQLKQVSWADLTCRESALELAPASEQTNWIARQDNYNGEVAGLIYEWRDNGSYRITGLAEGWVLK